ncbi:MAG: hypothetical protein AAF825_04715 [Pseudomonadota bacterium]
MIRALRWRYYTALLNTAEQASGPLGVSHIRWTFWKWGSTGILGSFLAALAAGLPLGILFGEQTGLGAASMVFICGFALAGYFIRDLFGLSMAVCRWTSAEKRLRLADPVAKRAAAKLAELERG